MFFRTCPKNIYHGVKLKKQCHDWIWTCQKIFFIQESNSMKSKRQIALCTWQKLLWTNKQILSKSVKHILESYYCLPDILVTQVSTNEKCKQLQIACHTCETTQMTENDYHYIMTNHTCDSVLSHAHNVFQKNRFSEQSNYVKIYVQNENIHVARENIVLRKSQNTLWRWLS